LKAPPRKAPLIDMTVLYFAHARRAAGVDSETFPLSAPITSDALWELLIARHPDLSALRASSRLARENDFLAADASLHPNDEIAVIPPVSGG